MMFKKNKQIFHLCKRINKLQEQLEIIDLLHERINDLEARLEEVELTMNGNGKNYTFHNGDFMENYDNEPSQGYQIYEIIEDSE